MDPRAGLPIDDEKKLENEMMLKLFPTWGQESNYYDASEMSQEEKHNLISNYHHNPDKKIQGEKLVKDIKELVRSDKLPLGPSLFHSKNGDFPELKWEEAMPDFLNENSVFVCLSAAIEKIHPKNKNLLNKVKNLLISSEFTKGIEKDISAAEDPKTLAQLTQTLGNVRGNKGGQDGLVVWATHGSRIPKK